MLIEATPRDAESLAALLPAGGDPGDPAGFRMTQNVGQPITAPDGITVTYDGAYQYRSVDVAPDLAFVVRIAAVALIVGWIRERFRGRTTKLLINRRSIDLDDEGQVRRVVEEEITQETRN